MLVGLNIKTTRKAAGEDELRGGRLRAETYANFIVTVYWAVSVLWLGLFREWYIVHSLTDSTLSRAYEAMFIVHCSLTKNARSTVIIDLSQRGKLIGPGNEMARLWWLFLRKRGRTCLETKLIGSKNKIDSSRRLSWLVREMKRKHERLWLSFSKTTPKCTRKYFEALSDTQQPKTTTSTRKKKRWENLDTSREISTSRY